MYEKAYETGDSARDDPEKSELIESSSPTLHVPRFNWRYLRLEIRHLC